MATATAFDTLTRVARIISGAPISFVSLMDEETQWIRGASGVKLDQSSREISFCTHAVEADEVMEVCDALSDPHFKLNPLVTGEPHIRYYLGIPIRGFNRLPIGTLCVIDDKPRLPLRDLELDGIMQLARNVEAMIEQARQARIREAQIADIGQDLELVSEAIEEQAETFATSVAGMRIAFTEIEEEIEKPTTDRAAVIRAIERGRSVTSGYLPENPVHRATWRGLVDCVAASSSEVARTRGITLETETADEAAGIPPANAHRTVERLVRASIEVAARDTRIGVRLRADGYFVCVSIYREAPALEVVRRGEEERACAFQRAREEATEAIIACGGYLEDKRWAGGRVIKAWYPTS